MATAKEKKLDKIPGFSQGVRDNAAVRMLKMARPICPNSKLKMAKDSEGKWVAAENQPQNCQLSNDPKWWETCAELGHNPYWTIRTWYEPVDLVEEDEDGNQIVTGQKRIKHQVKRPNIAQVAIHIRVNSGQGAIMKMRDHGFARLADIGFEEACQFRNCQKPLDPKYSGTSYGSYCSYNHLSLIAADVEGVALHYPSQLINGGEFEKVRKARQKQLREAVASA